MGTVIDFLPINNIGMIINTNTHTKVFKGE